MADTRAALFYVISHGAASNLKFWDVRFEVEVTGISLCRVASDIAAADNSAKNDKAERRTVFETAWRFGFLNVQLFFSGSPNLLDTIELLSECHEMISQSKFLCDAFFMGC